MKLLVLLILLFGCSSAKRTPSSVDLNQIIKKYDLPAIGYLKSDTNKTTFLEVAGRRDIYKDKAVTKNDRFHLGSNSKVMTSTLFAILVEEGHFSWSTPISDMAPQDYQVHPSLKKVTFLDLFRHRSGLETNPYQELWLDLWKMQENGESGEKQREVLAKYYLENKPQAIVGDYKYSNIGYSIAGFLIEKNLNSSFESLMEKYLFQKLKMHSCSHEAKGEDVPKGHKVVNGKRVSYHGGNPRVYSPAGRVSCSLEDWSQFARFHLKKYLSKDSNYTPFYQPPEKHYYAAGFIITKDGRFFHNGNNTLNYAILSIDPKSEEIILIVTNDGDQDVGVKAVHDLFKLLRK